MSLIHGIISALWHVIKHFWRETIIVLLLFACFFLWKTSKDALSAHLALENSYQTELLHYKDQYGDMVASKQAVELTVDELRTLNKYGNQRVDSLEGVVKKLNRLNSDLKFTIKSQNIIIGRLRGASVPDTGTPRPLEPADSTDMVPNPFPRIADYEDGFLTAVTIDTGDSLIMEYAYHDQFQATIYERRPGLLRKKAWVVEIKAKNPKTTITSADVVVVRDKVTLWRLIKEFFRRR